MCSDPITILVTASLCNKLPIYSYSVYKYILSSCHSARVLCVPICSMYTYKYVSIHVCEWARQSEWVNPHTYIHTRTLSVHDRVLWSLDVSIERKERENNDHFNNIYTHKKYIRMYVFAHKPKSYLSARGQEEKETDTPSITEPTHSGSALLYYV